MGDSQVVRGAAERGGSAASALDATILATAQALSGVQTLALQMPRELNQRADDLSKRLAKEVAEEIDQATGIPCLRVPAPEAMWATLRRMLE